MESGREPEKAKEPKKARDPYSVRRNGWTGEKRRRFLDTLAATGVATWAAKAAGMCYEAAAALRRRDPEFAALWRQAMIDAYYSVESMVVEHSVLGGAPPRDSEASGDLPDASKMDVELALKLLQMRHKTVLGNVQHPGAPPAIARKEDTDAAILKKLAVLRRRLGLPRDTDEW